MTKSKKKAEELTKEEIKDLAAIGIKAKDSAEARDKMVSYLEKYEIEVEETESFNELLEMCSVMYDDSDEEMNEIAEEVEEEEEEEEEEESFGEEEEDEEERKARAEAEAEEKANKQVQRRIVTKVADSKKAKKPRKVTKPRKERLNPQKRKEHRDVYECLKKVLPKNREFKFNYLANGGVSVKYKGINSVRVFLSFDSPRIAPENEIIGNTYLSSVKDEETLIALFGEDIETKIAWSGIREVVDISLSDVCYSMKKNKKEFEKVLAKLIKRDEKLGKNRQKMEEDLKSTKKAKVDALKGRIKSKKGK